MRQNEEETARESKFYQNLHQKPQKRFFPFFFSFQPILLQKILAKNSNRRNFP